MEDRFGLYSGSPKKVNTVILHTRDGGQRWERLNKGYLPVLNNIYFTDPENGWAIGDNGAIYKYSR